MAPPDLDVVLDLERQVWSALARGDASADEHLLHETFLGVYETGFGNRAEHVVQLAAGPVVSEFALLDARLLVLQADIVILSYLAEFRRCGRPVSGPPDRVYISSVWQRFDPGWKNVFSQDTTAREAPSRG